MTMAVLDNLESRWQGLPEHKNGVVMRVGLVGCLLVHLILWCANVQGAQKEGGQVRD